MFAIAVTCVGAPAHAQTVYRCPGPPVLYIDAITSEEARVKGCRPIESRWVEVAGNDDTKVYVDTQSMGRKGAKARIWLKWQNTKPSETAGYPKKSYLSEKALAIYDCPARSSATIQVIRYSDVDTSGEVVESLSVPVERAQFRDVAPETIGEVILNYVCIATLPPKK